MHSKMNMEESHVTVDYQGKFCARLTGEGDNSLVC